MGPALALAQVAWAVVGCGGTDTGTTGPAPSPALDAVPTVAFAVPTRDGVTPTPIPTIPDLLRVRAVLEKVVVDYARDPSNPWAIAHGMLALGPTMKLTNDADPVDWLFSEYATVAPVGDTPLVTFPRKRGRAIVEPHTDLVLKALTEVGVGPDRAVTVQGKPMVVADLYRYSLWRAWTQGTTTGFQQGGYNDTPWALQGLSAWAPPGLAWTAKGGRAMSMDLFTRSLLDQIDVETAEMKKAKAEGTLLKKDTRNGLFSYTCGGQHALQGAAYAVARGFGEPADRQRVCDQLDLLEWRVDVELAAVDPMLVTPGLDPAIAIVLLGQRLKFLGHWLETVHKIGALGLCPLDNDDLVASERVASELGRTVDALGALHIWDNLPAVRQDKRFDDVRQNGSEQVYLDFVGDSAHAVRGIDLATGTGTIRF